MYKVPNLCEVALINVLFFFQDRLCCKLSLNFFFKLSDKQAKMFCYSHIFKLCLVLIVLNMSGCVCVVLFFLLER